MRECNRCGHRVLEEEYEEFKNWPVMVRIISPLLYHFEKEHPEETMSLSDWLPVEMT